MPSSRGRLPARRPSPTRRSSALLEPARQRGRRRDPDHDGPATGREVGEGEAGGAHDGTLLKMIFIFARAGTPGNPAAERSPATPSDRKSTRLNSRHLGISYAVLAWPPPRSPPFAYTTLFRSPRAGAPARAAPRSRPRRPGHRAGGRRGRGGWGA